MRPKCLALERSLHGNILKPGNSGFQRIINSEYVDKTGLIRLINDAEGTVNNLICVSRPRRFGKSFAAQMLCAYYDCSCDSHALFDDKKIARTEEYLMHLNQYYVINLDITSFISEAKRRRMSMADVPNEIAENMHKELRNMFPNMTDGGSLTEDLIHCVEASG